MLHQSVLMSLQKEQMTWFTLILELDLSWFKDRIFNNNLIMVLFSQNITNNINNYQYYYYIFMMHLYLHLLFGGKTNAKFNL